MKNHAITVATAIVCILSIADSFVVRYQESTILRERQFIPSGLNTKPVEVKGKTYFVSENTFLWYKSSEYGFIGGCVVLVGLIAAAKATHRKN
jgi:hypothetical protein